MLYFKPLLLLELKNRLCLQLGFELSKTYSLSGELNQSLVTTTVQSTNDSNGNIIFLRANRIEQNPNPASKKNMVYPSSPEILVQYKLSNYFSIQLGLKVNFGFMGGGRFIDFYEYDRVEEKWNSTYYVVAKKTMTGTVGMSYNLSGLRKKRKVEMNHW